MPDAINGLTSREAQRRLRESGFNVMPEAPAVPLWRRAARQFQSPLIYILLVALIFDLGVWILEAADTWPIEAIAIFAILMLNAGLGTLQEYRSEQALAKLRELAAPMAWVRRDGRFERIPGSEIVPGDVVRVSAGERIPADGKLLDGSGVMVDEAVLTGESVPVEKEPGDILFSGTLMVRARGHLGVERTGPGSSMGRLATMLGSIATEPTPLEQRLRHLGHQIALWVGGLAVGLAVVGIFAEGLGRAPEIIVFAVALAVAAVPEGMPAVVTLTLALGVQRMARRKAVVRRLSAVEALGSVTVIATDKTGTLTENRMQVGSVDALDPAQALLAMVLANEADPASGAGDPLDRGLLEYAAANGLDAIAVHQAHPRLSAQPFDSAWKFSRVTVSTPDGPRSYLKGAPEIILARTNLDAAGRVLWAERAERAAHGGHRVLALATGDGERDSGLDLLGLVLLWDPPRAEVPEAIAQVQQAGVRVIMITGDHPGTAQAIARHIGMASTEAMTGAELEQLDDAALQLAVKRISVFARVSPEHKLRLVQALQAAGEFVAMTGDGVNDAPALKRANVGVAMGQRGSDVSREVADLVLLDDNFATIVGAIEEGRGIYANIQKFIRFLFSTNLALVLLVVLGAVVAFTLDLRDAHGMLLLPLTAIQLLWINLIADGPPALALTLDRNPGVMAQPPRPPQSPLLDRASMRFVIGSGVVKAAAGGGLLVGLPLAGYGLGLTRTAVFLFESLAQLVFAYPSRRLGHRPLCNWTLHLVIVATIALQLATIAMPSLRATLGLEALDAGVLTLVTTSVGLTWLLTGAIMRWAARAQPPAAPVRETEVADVDLR
jgi:P-type Ca2+ transporter type 2C